MSPRRVHFETIRHQSVVRSRVTRDQDCREDLVPSSAPQLFSEDRTALRAYLALYRERGSTIAGSAGFPFLDKSSCTALEEDDWELYLRDLREHATRAASAGLTFVEWLELAVRYRKTALAAFCDLPDITPSTFATLTRGVDRLIEIAIHTMGETYSALRLQNVAASEDHHRTALEAKAFAMSELHHDSKLQAAAPSRVLLVEDDRDLLHTLVRALQRNGHTVVGAEGERQALAALELESFDVVISDVHMPDGSGLDLLRVVRRIDLDVPVILITGIADLHSAAAALAYGAFRYLAKPLDLDVLQTTILHARRAHVLARVRRRAVSVTGGHAGAADRAGLEVRFEQALGSLWIAFQPIYRAGGGALFGVEALLRSNEPSLPSPTAVLDAASQLGRGTALGRRVRALAAHGVMEHEGLQLFVNLQPEDLTDADLTSDTASLSKIASRVVLEITERSALPASAELSPRISHLRALGFRIAVDDIGAGYSGLTSFADLMPEIVKIDMALVRNIHLSTHRQRTVKALCNLCHDVGCLVIGEGVETDGERDCLEELGCDLLQGYLLGRPHAALPAAAEAMRPAQTLLTPPTIAAP
jgi:EAL domain-containing protein (putative c-di-GMP-specific phosphodiesterase class I)/ActR/RegA family two-component response regulator